VTKPRVSSFSNRCKIELRRLTKSSPARRFDAGKFFGTVPGAMTLTPCLYAIARLSRRCRQRVLSGRASCRSAGSRPRYDRCIHFPQSISLSASSPSRGRPHIISAMVHSATAVIAISRLSINSMPDSPSLPIHVGSRAGPSKTNVLHPLTNTKKTRLRATSAGSGV